MSQHNLFISSIFVNINPAAALGSTPAVTMVTSGVCQRAERVVIDVGPFPDRPSDVTVVIRGSSWTLSGPFSGGGASADSCQIHHHRHETAAGSKLHSAITRSNRSVTTRTKLNVWWKPAPSRRLLTPPRTQPGSSTQ